MNWLLARLLTTLLIASYALAGHPVEEAEAKLEKAKGLYAQAEKRFLASLELIKDAEKQQTTRKAFQARKAAWKKVTAAEIELKIAASPAPSTSTGSTAAYSFIEAQQLELQAQKLNEEAEWIEGNWK